MLPDPFLTDPRGVWEQVQYGWNVCHVLNLNGLKSEPPTFLHVAQKAVHRSRCKG